MTKSGNFLILQKYTWRVAWGVMGAWHFGVKKECRSWDPVVDLEAEEVL